MPPEQQTEISPEEVGRRESLTSRRESIFSRRDSLFSRRGSLYGAQNEEGKISENGTSAEEDKIVENENEVPPEPEPVQLSPEEEKRLREEEEQIRKKIAIEMRKAELRAKMEEASKARRAKKGFMTPERKKKLRLLLRRKAAEELRKEQERKANERRWVIEERCGEPEDLEWASKDDLIDICEDYFQRIIDIESDKWDLEFEIRKQTLEIAELTQKVSDLRGKFQRPVLKKVSKYENKFAKLQRKAAEYNFRSQLKIVRRPDYKPKEEEKKLHVDKAIEDAENVEKGEESEDTKDDATDAADRTSLRSIERVETPKTIEGDVDINEEGAEVEDYIKAVYTGRADSAQGSRVGVDSPAATPEGDAREVREGGQSPEESGEVQPSDISGSSEPPPPPQPQHSPDDLWDYLKESVTGERPATVEEFVQKLIGTLEHVPEEYLQPVIEYNIRRANSPSVTDGEYLHEKDTAHHSEGEDHGVEQIQSEEAHSRENGEVDFERGDNTIEPTEGESQFAEDDGYAPEETSAPHEDASQIPDDPSEEPSESTEGYSALEAAT